MNTVLVIVVFADGLPEFNGPQAVGIVGVSVINGPGSCLTDTVGRLEIGLANFQVDNVSPLAFKFMGPFKDIHYDEWRDFLRPSAESGHFGIFSLVLASKTQSHQGLAQE